MNNKVIILGNGFIASHFDYEIVKERLTPTENEVKELVYKYNPATIINCIGYCGVKNIDDCESNKTKTLNSNVLVPLMLASECEKQNIKLINIGSGCIFSGKSPNVKDSCTTNNCDAGWKEKDFANPQSYYSNTKYACDLAIGTFSNVCTLRIRMPLSYKDSPRNFINKVSKYQNIIDIQNSMTIVEDLVRCVDWVIENDKSGIYHVTNPGTTTAVDVMQEYKKYVPEHSFSIISEQELNAITSAKRSNCLLNSDKLKREGFVMNHIHSAMRDCMKKYFKTKG